jgi:5'-methylthioadenosine phosphorylase
LPSQLIDRTKGIRPSTFYDGSIVVHAAFGDPFAESLSKLISSASGVLKNARMHVDKTLVVMEGPAFSTRAESRLYRQWGGDIINMSALPESKLAREAEIEYQMVCMSTDYDSWREEEEAVTADLIIANLMANAENAKTLLKAVLEKMSDAPNPLKGSVKNGIITAPEKRPPEEVKKLNWLLPGTF